MEKGGGHSRALWGTTTYKAKEQGLLGKGEPHTKWGRKGDKIEMKVNRIPSSKKRQKFSDGGCGQ